MADTQNTETNAAPDASALEEARERVRALKARMAPQAEVRAAVDAYVALKSGNPLPTDDTPVSEVKMHLPEPEAAPQQTEQKEEPKAAVPAEILEGYTIPALPEVELPTSLEAAAEYVKALKAKMASQREVARAVDHYRSLKRAEAISSAAEKVQKIKDNQNASPAELKAAEAAYEALVSPPPVHHSASPVFAPSSSPQVQESETKAPEGELSAEQTAEKVRSLKANKAPEEEVKAAVATYLAAKVPRVAVKSPEVDAAAKVVQDLKAKMAPQSEVRLAVEAYLALKYPTANSEPLTEAIERIRTLKANLASQEEVKAAVDAYVALRDGTSLSPEALSPLEAAANKVRELKAARAPQADVTAAVQAYVALKGEAGAEVREVKQAVPASEENLTPLDLAARKVRQLKAARASQAEVSAAVAEYVALTKGQSAPAAPSESSQPSETPSQAFCPEASPQVAALAERVRSLKAQNAIPALVKDAVDAYSALADAEAHVNSLKARNAPEAEVSAAVSAYTARANAPINACSEVRAAADQVITLKASNASPEEVGAAVARLVALETAAAEVQKRKAENASPEDVQAAVDAFAGMCKSEGEPAVNVHLPQ